MNSSAGVSGNLPLLAVALAALAGARASFEEAAEPLARRFVGAVARMDEADREYRGAVERILPGERGREMLAAMAGFRAEVAELRERTRAAAGYGDFDPLDTYVPSLSVSHAEAVRAANTADLARGEVAALRTRVNARIAGLLDADEIALLTAAKRARQAAFDRAIRDAVPAQVGDRVATQLMLLADGWY